MFSDLLFWPLGPFRDVSVTFVMRRSGVLWGISDRLSQVADFLYEVGKVFLLDHNTDYVVLTRS